MEPTDAADLDAADLAAAADASVLASVRRRLLRGSSWVLLARVAGIVLGVVINALLARLLTPAEFGSYFLAFTLVIVGSLVAQLGLDRAVVRLVSQSLGLGRPGRAREAIRRTFRVGLAAAAVAGAALALGVGSWLARDVFDEPLLEAVMPVTAGWLVAQTVQSLVVETFRGLQRFDRATVFDTLLVDVLMAGIFGAMFVLGARDVGLATVVAVAAGVTGAVTVAASVLLAGQVRRISGEERLEPRAMLDIAWPSLVTNLAIYLLGSGVDLLVLGAFRPAREVALYGAATRLVTLVATPLWILRGVMPPMISELHAQGRRRELERTLRAGATLAGLPSFVILVVFVFAGGWLMGQVYGPAYRDGALVLAILSTGRMMGVWAGACGVTLIMTGHQKAMMVVTTCTGLLSVALGMLVARRFGGVGVATATMSVAFLQNGLQLILAKRLAGVWTHMQFSPAALRRFFSRKRRPQPSDPRGPGA